MTHRLTEMSNTIAHGIYKASILIATLLFTCKRKALKDRFAHHHRAIDLLIAVAKIDRCGLRLDLISKESARSHRYTTSRTSCTIPLVIPMHLPRQQIHLV